MKENELRLIAGTDAEAVAPEGMGVPKVVHDFDREAVSMLRSCSRVDEPFPDDAA